MRRLADLALAALTLGGAAALTFGQGFGIAEFAFVAILWALLTLALRHAAITWLTAHAQRRRAAELARTTPTEAALRAADEESERMATDIRATLHATLEAIAHEVTLARPAAPDRAVEHLAAIQRHAVVATTELRRMLGLLRATHPSDDAAPPPAHRRPRRVLRLVAVGLMQLEIIATSQLWAEGNGAVDPAEPLLMVTQLTLSTMALAVFFAPVDAPLACLCTAGLFALGFAVGAPLLDGVWLGIVLALMSWRIIARPAVPRWGLVALVALWAAAGTSIATFSPGNLGVHCVMVGSATATAAAARLGDRTRTDAEARAATAAGELASETARAVRERRLEVARTLHDALSGTVGVVVAQTGAAEVLWRSRPDQAKAALEVVAEAVAHARVDLEPVALGPAPQQRPGLAEIPGLVRRMRDAGIDVVLVALPASAPQEAGAAAYRIVQECLANVARHAPGAAAEVHVALRDGGLSISVSDDGPGLSPTDRGGYGLTGLRERVGLLGGRLTLDSTPPGLRVLARLPIRQEVA